MAGLVLRAAALVLVAAPPAAVAFYLPGVAPRQYASGEEVQLKVNRMTSQRTQLPYNFYDLPFCQPAGGVVDSAENLGEILTGNVIENSAYTINMYKAVTCGVVCVKTFTDAEAERFVNKIEEQYIINMIMDNLPAAYKTVSESGTETLAFYSHGFPLGGVVVTPDGVKMQHFLNNHLAFVVQYHIPDFEAEKKQKEDVAAEDAGELSFGRAPARIVGLLVEPFSIKHKYDAKSNSVKVCPAETAPVAQVKYGQSIDKGTEVVFTYSVQWQESAVKWASRWDVYLSSKNKAAEEVHWFSIVNSLLIVVFLSGMVAMILLRTLHRDLSRYNRIATEEEKAEEREETGWKLVHGDVFRAPSLPMVFSFTVGTGVQVLTMTMLTIGFATMGFLSPANRGSLMIALILLFMFLGIAAGYFSARTYKAFNGAHWQRCTLGTALAYPGLIAAMLFGLNLVIWAEGSSSAIPFGSMLAVMSLWFCISVPLTFLGAFYGYKQDVDKMPVQTQDIPRAIPAQPWFMSPFLTILISGILPFGAVFVELFFILSSLWLDQYYSLFGFLLIVFFILIVTCAEITLVLVYFQLCGEDYHWHWRSVFTSGSSAVYLFLYSIFYFSSRLRMDLFVSAVLFFGYMLIISILFFLATSCIGYYATHAFLVKIFGSIKVD